MRREEDVRSASEGLAFESFTAACHGGSPREALDQLMIWLGVCCGSSEEAAIGDFARSVGDRDLAEEIVRTTRASAAGSVDWSGIDLARAATRTRERYLETLSGEGRSIPRKESRK